MEIIITSSVYYSYLILTVTVLWIYSHLKGKFLWSAIVQPTIFCWYFSIWWETFWNCSSYIETRSISCWYWHSLVVPFGCQYNLISGWSSNCWSRPSIGIDIVGELKFTWPGLYCPFGKPSLRAFCHGAAMFIWSQLLWEEGRDEPAETPYP